MNGRGEYRIIIRVMKMRKILPWLGLLLALTGCAGPNGTAVPAVTPEETVNSTGAAAPVPTPIPAPTPERPDYVDHIVTVGEDEYTVRMRGEPGQYILNTNAMVLTRVEVYRGGDFSAPFQVLEEYGSNPVEPLPMDGEFLVRDVNFDGWTDFCYEELDYRGNLELSQMLWDPEEGRFVRAERGVCNPTYDMGTGLVYEVRGSGLWGFTQWVSRWEGKSLVPVCGFEVHGFEEAGNIWYLERDGELAAAREWTGEIAEDGSRLLPGAEAYYALSKPLEKIEDPAEGEYAEWRLIDMGPGRPLYGARLASDYTDEGPGARHNILKRIEFYHPENLEAPFQVIPLEDGGASGNLFPPGTAFGFGLEDLNFDGWPDLRFFKMLGNVNAVDYGLLYDPETGTFERNKTLEGICFLELDREKKALYGWERGGWGMYFDYIYRWVDGEPRMVRMVGSEPATDGMETDSDYTVWDYVDGELREVKHYVNLWREGGETAFAELDRWRTDPDYHGEDGA